MVEDDVPDFFRNRISSRFTRRRDRYSAPFKDARKRLDERRFPCSLRALECDQNSLFGHEFGKSSRSSAIFHVKKNCERDALSE
jgi:hypothetical protein